MNPSAITPTTSTNGRNRYDYDHDHHTPEPLGELTPTGWVAPHNMTYEQWCEFGATIGRIADSVNWWAGDWILAGEFRWGQRYLQAVHVLGWNEQRLMDAVSVARRVPPDQRKPNLSWSHHRAVTRYAEEPERQQEWLETAEAEGLSVGELRVAIREAEGEPAPINYCLLCQDWLQAIGNRDLCIALAIEQGHEHDPHREGDSAWLAAAVYLSKRFNYMAIRTGEEV